MKMIIMAQHPQQKHEGQQKIQAQQYPAQASAEFKSSKITKSDSTKLSSPSCITVQRQQQQDQDGKRTIIKNQLYLIEQLQLENANLRNERDQLQLENEELKFQLQMINSSNILSQPGATFNDQQLERLVASNNKVDSNNPPTNQKAALTATTTNNNATMTPTISSQVRLLATPIRQPMYKLNGEQGQRAPSAAEELSHSVAATTIVRASAPAFSNESGANLLDGGNIDSVAPFSGTLNKLLSGKSTSLAPFNVKPLPASRSRGLPQDDEEQRVKLVEQFYGDGDRVQAAAVIIQRAFRKYQICKRFRTITEQLRHTCQPIGRDAEQNSKAIVRPRSTGSGDKAPDGLVCTSGLTRALAWDSLSYAANRLAASAASEQAKQFSSSAPSKLPPSPCAFQQQLSRLQPDRAPNKQDPVVAAAINFQQLESIRKRQYRVGLNIFNKNPEKGVSFLVAHSFIDSSSPYTKPSTSYYHSTQLHFIDKQKSIQQSLTSNSRSCKLCFEEDNLKRNIAHFLLHRKGLAKEKIGQYLGNLQAQFNQDVLKYYLQELDFYGLQVDLGLRKFLSTFRLPGEAQKIERIVDCFAQRYVQCQQQQQQQSTGNGNISQLQYNHQQVNQQHQQGQTIQLAHKQSVLDCRNNLMLLSKDEIFILTFAIIMLNTDLHSPSLKPTSRMSASQFVNNLRGVFKSQSISESDLVEIYERVKANQISTTPDHVNHVMKVQQGLTVTNFQRKELPNLCVPYRRLVCFCRLFEVYDINKKERFGQHQREIFLFNDLLLVTKIARRVRANAGQLYAYRQTISLQGLYVQLFQSSYYNHGIRLCQRSNDETIIMFNARNELDQSRFVDDLGESIAEMDEMETIRAHNIIETIHLKYLDRLRRHSMMHEAIENNQVTNRLVRNHESGETSSLMTNCDTRNTRSENLLEFRDLKQEDCSEEELAGRAGPVHTKFNSMLNLSNKPVDSEATTVGFDTREQTLAKDLKQNLVAETEQPQANDKQQTAANQSDQMVAQRRCSANSVHSLDSGLFLSRDVSPNQSS